MTLKICGSVHAGFALKQSNTNVRIIVPKSTNRALVITDIEKILSSTGKKEVMTYCSDSIYIYSFWENFNQKLSIIIVAYLTVF